MRTDKSKQHPKPRHAKPQPDTQPDKEHGEGNYKASRQYNDATREFVESGQVDTAAAEAKPHDSQERKEMHDAERAGREKSKGEDPQLYKDGRKSADHD